MIWVEPLVVYRRSSYRPESLLTSGAACTITASASAAVMLRCSSRSGVLSGTLLVFLLLYDRVAIHMVKETRYIEMLDETLSTLVSHED